MKFEFKARIIEPIIVVTILLVSALIIFSNLTRGHVWGDDFAGYLDQARSLLEGDPQTVVDHNIQMNQWSSSRPGPDAYPWGYPYLLSPLLAVFGLSPLVFKSLNIVFFILGLWTVYQFAKKRLSPLPALIVLGLLAFSPLFIQMNDLIQSDIPFFAMVYTVFWLKDRLEQRSIVKQVFLGILIFFAIFTRATGVLLLLYIIPDLYNARKDSEKFLFTLIPVITVAALFVIQFLLLPTGETSYFSHFDLFTWQAISRNIGIYFQAGNSLFGSSSMAISFYILCWLLFLFAQVQALKKDIATQLFFYAMLFILIIWPEDQGARFLLPVLPIFLVRVFEGVDVLKKRFAWLEPIFFALSAIWIVSFLVNASVSGINNIRSNREINGPFDPVSTEAFSAVREYSDPSDVLVFFKPRAAMLFTGLSSYNAETCSGLIHADLLLINLKQDRNLQIEPSAVTDCALVVKKQLFENKRFVLYAIDRSLIPQEQ